MFYFREEFGSLDMLNGVIPSFDARLVSYPNLKSLRDYFSWRQVDCHINNLYNYCFWLLVCGGVDFVNRYGISEEKLAIVREKDKQFREINQEGSLNKTGQEDETEPS
jgi:tRNA(His) guanylyltransferase